MKFRYPTNQTSLGISLDVYNQLQWASCTTGYEKEDWEIATEAIDQWVRRNDPNALQSPTYAGYQWKGLFLPDGTVLRTVFGRKNYHCLVEGEQIVYDKRTVSPSGFVNAVGGIRRNAWKNTWILFPDSKEWKLADSLRTRARPGRARKLASAFQPEPQQANAAAPIEVPPVPAERAEVQPATATPSRVVPPSRRRRLALAAFKARHARHVVHGPLPVARDDVRNEPPRGPESTPSLADFTHGHDRRVNGDDRMAAWLRQELLPLLCRMASLDGQRAASTASAGLRTSELTAFTSP